MSDKKVIQCINLTITYDEIEAIQLVSNFMKPGVKSIKFQMKSGNVLKTDYVADIAANAWMSKLKNHFKIMHPKEL